MSYAWYLYTPLTRAAASDVVADVLASAGDEPPLFEVCEWSPPSLAEMLEQCEDPRGLATRYAECISVIRIDRPSDEPADLAAARLLLARMNGAIVNRGGELERAEDVLAQLPTRPERSTPTNMVAHAEATLAKFADLADLADLTLPDVAAAAELLALLRSGVVPAEAPTPLAQSYLKRLIQFGPLADSDAARVLEVSPAQIAALRTKLRDSFRRR